MDAEGNQRAFVAWIRDPAARRDTGVFIVREDSQEVRPFSQLEPTLAAETGPWDGSRPKPQR
jgi:hypothetical protein